MLSSSTIKGAASRRPAPRARRLAPAPTAPVTVCTDTACAPPATSAPSTLSPAPTGVIARTAGSVPTSAAQPVDRTATSPNDIAVLGHVLHDPRTRGLEPAHPLVLDRPHKLDHRQDLVAVGGGLGGQRRAVGEGVDLGVGQAHLAHVIAPVGTGLAQAGVVLTDRLGEGELAVAGHHARVAAGERRLALGGVRDHQQVPAAVRGGPVCAREATSGQEGGGDQRQCE